MTPDIAVRSRLLEDRVTVLLVDDEPDFAELTAEFLEREDDRFDVVVETSARGGLDRLDEERIDCIVSDYDMPTMDGLEFLQAVREGHPDLPFILYTGKGSEEIASEAISAGVTDYLQKETGAHQYTVLANRIRNCVEQYRAEQQVRETRERFSKLLKESSDFIFTVDADGVIQYVTPSVERILGYRPEALVETDAFEHVHPDDLDTARAGFADVVGAPGGETTVEFRAQHSDGSWRWLEVRGRNLLDDPVIEGVVVNVRDITRRKERERELERAKRRFQRLFEQSYDAIMVVDPSEGVIRDANSRACELFGYDREELLSLSPADLHPEDIERFQAFVDTVYEEGAGWTDDVACVTKSGDRLPVEVSASTIELDDHPNILAHIRDISDRKTREQRLSELHDATRQLMAATEFEAAATIGVEAADEILDLDISGFHTPNDDGDKLVPVAITDEARDLFDGAPVIDRSESLAGRAYERGEAIFTADVREHADVTNPETPVRSELLIPVGDHGVFIAASTEPDAFDDSDEDLARVLVSNLEHAIDSVRRERQLRERERALERENERLEEVASIISHDLRNPLNVIQGRLELAREECESDHFEPMVSAIHRSLDIVDDVLTLVRQGQSIEEIEPVTLSTVVESCWRNVDTANADFEIEEDLTFEANPDRFRHVLENLFRNAVEHGDSDVTIRIGRVDGGFYVEDDGVGLPADDRDKVFDSGYTTSEEGTGFGLHIVKQVVDAHGWTISVAEPEGDGARFEITGIAPQ